MALNRRYHRLHEQSEQKRRKDDHRTPGQRDRDRILHSSALRRLAAVTQVVTPTEGYSYHNRLTHTLKVAQIGRRLAERVLVKQKKKADALGGIDPDVVEAAALAHDLGHPPFGHVAERHLDKLLVDCNVRDGYDGNAQTFRIVNRLAVRTHVSPGLDLTRATLNAILKYPWLRQSSGKESTKWGAYHTEKKEFDWARELYPNDRRKSVEAELMDWADDIAFSVHDMEDYYRAGLIPLDRLVLQRDFV